MPELKLTLERDQIRGFSYSFTRALVTKLEALYQADELFKDGNEKSSNKNYSHTYTKLGVVINSYLQEQLRQSFDTNTAGVELMIQTGKEFLSIFENSKGQKVVYTSIDLDQSLVEFMEKNFDKSPVPGGWKIRGYDWTVCWAKKEDGPKTLKDFLNNRNLSGRVRNVGKKSLEHIKNEFERLGIETRNYPFFQ